MPFEELAGNQYVFHIRVIPFNFTSNHRNFTVSAITEDVLLDPLNEVVSSDIFKFITLEAKKNTNPFIFLKET